MKQKAGVLKNVIKQVRTAKTRESGAPTSGTGGVRWQDELKALKLADIKKRAPGFYLASGGDKMKIQGYTDRTSNGLTRAIIDFLNLSGHYANRINTQGQARVKRIPKFNILSGQVDQHEKVHYTKSRTAKELPI